MSRPLLIALLSLVAISGPAAAQAHPTAGSPDLPSPDDVLDLVDLDVASVPCSLTGSCSALRVSTTCRPYDVTFDQNNWPGFNAGVDPDYCIRGFVDHALGWPPGTQSLFVGLTGLSPELTLDAPSLA